MKIVESSQVREVPQLNKKDTERVKKECVGKVVFCVKCNCRYKVEEGDATFQRHFLQVLYYTVPCPSCGNVNQLEIDICELP